MPQIYKAISDRKPVLLEGACGTGKTITALAPATAYAIQYDKRIIIATSVKAQTGQFILEARFISVTKSLSLIKLFITTYLQYVVHMSFALKISRLL